MGVSSPGIGSGLDVNKMVDAYVKAEITPMQVKQDKQLNSVNTELSAVGQLKSYLSNLQASLTKLSDLSQFYSMKYTLSDPDALTTNITPQALKGSYQIEVQKLAQQQSLASNYIPDVSNVGSGALTITLGTYNADKTSFVANSEVTPVTLNIAPGSGSLIAVRDAINNSAAGVTATIVTDNAGSRLAISSNQTGEKYAMKISGGFSSLNYDPTTGINALSETNAAVDSQVKVNGLLVTQSSNVLKDAVTGVTLTLKKAEMGKTITINIDDNKDQLTSLVNEFVKQYNDSLTFLTNLTGYNPETKKGGVFQGDPQFRNLKLNLNKWATTPLANNNGPIKNLADLGVITNKQGLLEIDKTKYDKVIASNYKDIGALFAKTAVVSDPNIRLKSIDAKKTTAGTYDVVLSTFSPGVSMSGTIGGLNATSGDGKILNGSGKLSGLSLDVLSGSTGARGTIKITDGIAVLLNEFLDTYMGTKGDLTLRNNQLTKQVKLLEKSQATIDTRTSSLSKRYFKQFSDLDVLMSKLSGVSTALTQQLATIPSSTRTN